MRKLSLLAGGALAFWSAAAGAAWTQVEALQGDLPPSENSILVDMDTLRRDQKGMATITALREFSDGKRQRSSIGELEIDCKRKRLRELRLMVYSDKAAQGTGKLGKHNPNFMSIKHQGAAPWIPAFRAVCNPKKPPA